MSVTHNIELSGRVGKAPELRHTASGKPATSFSLAVTPRIHNRQTNEWSDGQTTWYEVKAYGRLAENVAASIVVGANVMVTGRVSLETYTKRDGTTGMSLEVFATDIGISLDHQTAQITNTKSYGANSGGGNGGGQWGNGGGAPVNVPQAAYNNQPPPMANGFDDEQPF